MAGLLQTFANRWEASPEAVLLVPFDRFVTGRIPSLEEYPWPYIAVIPGSGRLQYRSDKYEGLRRTLTVHVWVDPYKLEDGEQIQELVRRLYANEAWTYDYGRVIDVLDGGVNAHQINDPTYQCWELVRLLTLCIEQPRVDTPVCTLPASSGSSAGSSASRRSGSSLRSMRSMSAASR